MLMTSCTARLMLEQPRQVKIFRNKSLPWANRHHKQLSKTGQKPWMQIKLVLQPTPRTSPSSLCLKCLGMEQERLKPCLHLTSQGLVLVPSYPWNNQDKPFPSSNTCKTMYLTAVECIRYIKYGFFIQLSAGICTEAFRIHSLNKC